MLYYLLDWLDAQYNIPGFGVFQYISFRAMMSIIFSLIISLLIGKKIINLLRRKQIGEVVREGSLGPDHAHKRGTPTMGGVIIIAAIVIPTLLWGDLKNGYVWLILLATIWMGTIGFIDDYIKVFKKDKAGLKGRFKIVGQVSLGLIVGLVMLYHPDFMGSRKHITSLNRITGSQLLINQGFKSGDEVVAINGIELQTYPGAEKYDSLHTYLVNRPHFEENEIDYDKEPEEITLTIAPAIRSQVANEIFGPRDKSFVYRTDFPFFKEYVFDYSKIRILELFIEEGILGRIVYLLVVIFIITALSNAVNLTDGIDGLAAGTSAITGTTLAIFAYVSGNAIFSSYLNISYIPLSSELVVYGTALVGGCIGFLWYNSFPAQVFMGDTGSLALGGAIGVMALMVKKELLIPIICGVFLAETLSVIIQVTYFRYTKKKYGEGRRIFKMSPLHHHYEKKGIHESKIVMRFLIVSVALAILAFATLKLR